jgi:hypothetical protein
LTTDIQALKNNQLYTLGDWKKLPKRDRYHLSTNMAVHPIPIMFKVLLNKIAPPEEDEFGQIEFIYRVALFE